MELNHLETPCLVVERGKTERNISRMLRRMEILGVSLRPHGKTVKNIDILRMSLKGQPGGIAVSTLREADYYSAHGIKDITYAVGIAPVKLDRVAGLIKGGVNLSLLLDSARQISLAGGKAREYSIEIPVFIEIDCDGHRSGVAPAGPDLKKLGQALRKEEGVILQGILTHAGESYNSRNIEEIREISEQERDAAVSSAELLEEAGLPCPAVSVGSTPTAGFAEDLTGVTEVRAGVFMFYDLTMAGLGVCDISDISISVLASVIGHKKSRGWIITDAGWTALSSDRSAASQEMGSGFGMVCDIEGNPISGLMVSSVNQEHGIITDRAGGRIPWQDVQIGTTLRILPNHACATAAMHDHYVVVDGDTGVIDRWQRVNGW